MRSIAMTFATLIIVVLAGGCQQPAAERASESESNARQASAAVEQATAPAETVASTTSDGIDIKGEDGQTVVRISAKGGATTAEFGPAGNRQLLRGRLRESGKRKYETNGGSVVAEVKLSDDGFKVRTPDGKLLWKIKIKEGKVKISDNEENANPFVLKIKDERDKTKVLDSTEKEIAQVKYYRDRGRVEVKDPANRELYKINTSHYSPIYGVMVMDRIPIQERAIIMAELLARGI